MVKFYFATFLAASFLSVSAAAPMPKVKLPESPLSKTKINVKHAPARSAENPATSFEATQAEVWYYGDLADNGTGAYRIFLSNCPMSGGNPVGEGQYFSTLIFGYLFEYEENPVLPTGVYSYGLDYAENTFTPDYSVFMDCFTDPDNPVDGDLVAYQWIPESGEVSINISSGNSDEYEISFSGAGSIYIAGGDDMTDNLSCSYLGAVTYVDPNGYTPLPDETYELNIPNISGRFMPSEEFGYGNYSIAFYSVPLDDEGFIQGAGDLLNVEFLVGLEYGATPEGLIGTFEVAPFYGDSFTPGHFVGGAWYEIWDGLFIPAGTALQVLDEYGNYKYIGLATDGKITVTRDDATGNFKFVFDLISAEGTAMTGTWEGELNADNILDLETGVDEIGSERLDITAGNGFINAPEGAKVYNICGKECGKTELEKGIYIVSVNGKSVKVHVR